MKNTQPVNKLESSNKLFGVIAGMISLTNNIPLNQVDKKKVKRVFATMSNKDKIRMTKHVDKSGEEAAISKFVLEIKINVAMSVIVPAIAQVHGISLAEIKQSSIRERVFTLSEPQIRAYGDSIQRLGKDKTIQNIAQDLRGSM